MAGKISPSMMCVDFRRLEESVRAMEQAGVEYLHFDIMDGHFVPNFTLGPDFISCVREMTNIPFDYHLMVERPELLLSVFDIRKGDIVTVHQEASIHLQRTLQQIRDMGARPSVALNPATPVYALDEVMDDLELVLIMTVNPGFAGQKLVPSTIRKIAGLKERLRAGGHSHVEIEVDGNVSWDNAAKMRHAGADIFVAGTSSVFRKDEDIQALLAKFRSCIA
ncbi:ribulose-phosphate 3-epimerase [Cohnella fermenti]|uniref:Ribulose-phosphate 3-epimerase n=1 Tax=Cohnella fermenti TaxID=2565925 RepID=A0A4S4C3L7_9BACL|nr:ribulose-phosphate 3-epimerase [Cohnella fermenti]THF82250.1 ribulose-phosphate 3-epimerase [Cohnella fermenti]